MRRLMTLAFLALALAGGCKKGGPSPTATQGAAGEFDDTLVRLNRELRRTMVRQRLSGSFEEFAAVRTDLEIPPPPPGKKYVINKKWKIVLEDR